MNNQTPLQIEVLYEQIAPLYDDPENGIRVSWLWNPEDNEALQCPKWDWEQFLYNQCAEILKEDSLVVQAGGCLGMYPKLLSAMCKDVYTFEPHPTNFRYLEMNAPNARVRKFNCALGAYPHEAVLHEHFAINSGMHQMKEVSCIQFKTGNEYTVEVKTIDDLDLPKCDLIFLDIEKYEIFALTGAIKTIEKYKPAIIVENDTVEIYHLLKPFGYDITAVDGMNTVYKAL